MRKQKEHGAGHYDRLSFCRFSIVLELGRYSFWCFWIFVHPLWSIYFSAWPSAPYPTTDNKVTETDLSVSCLSSLSYCFPQCYFNRFYVLLFQRYLWYREHDPCRNVYRDYICSSYS